MPTISFEELFQDMRQRLDNYGITDAMSIGLTRPSSGGTPHHPDTATTDLEIIFKSRREDRQQNQGSQGP